MTSWSPSGGEGGVGIVPNRTRVIIIYPTVDPQVVVVPIISSICIFPVVAFLVICCLRKMAARRRRRARLTHRGEAWSERSCASIVQRSPPLSYSGDKFGEGTTSVELMTPDQVLDDERDSLVKPQNGTHLQNHCEECKGGTLLTSIEQTCLSYNETIPAEINNHI